LSGHSKWSTIKRAKGKLDAERGKIFTRLTKEIAVAAREGGGNPDSNARLRTAIVAAKAANMPSDNIKRSIQKGTGELPGVTYENVTYEGYGPAGVAIFLQVMTDNKNRTVAEIRHVLAKWGGNLGSNGSVSWMFKQKGIITIELSATTEGALMDVALDAGAEDITSDTGSFEVVTPPDALEDVKAAIEKKGIKMVSAEITMQPSNMVKLTTEKDANAMLRLYEALEEMDDVQKVYANFDIEQSLLEKVA
jgi:YebC/PmpR family DNA-binding regulatory protein